MCLLVSRLRPLTDATACAPAIEDEDDDDDLNDNSGDHKTM